MALTPEEARKLRDQFKEVGIELELVDKLFEQLGKRQENLTQSTADHLDKLMESSKAHRDNIQLLEQQAAAQKKFTDLSEQVFGITEKTSTYFEGIRKSHEAGYEQAKRQQSLALKRAKQLELELADHRENKTLNDEDYEQKIQLYTKYKLHIKDTARRLALMRAANEELKTQEAGYKEIEKSTAGWIQNLTGVTESGFKDSILGKIDAVGGFANALAASGIQMAQTLTVANVLGSGITGIFNETIKMVAQTDNATAGFYKATGASSEYNSMIREVREESAIFGVNIGESAEAIQTLYTQMAGFTDLSKEAKKDVANFTARMGQLGIAAGTTADLLNSGTKSLNLTSKESQKMVLEVTKAARSLNIPVAQMTEDLKAAMPTLAAYGAAGVKIFKNIAAQAKQAGLATSDLLGITEQFDTFEGAAESVGRLNGILGGNYLNSLEMVNMSEDERVRTLVQTFEMTGKNWEALGKYERKAIAASIGISDMDKANKLLGMSTEELDKKMSGADAGILSPEQMQEMADKARSFSEKLENIWQSMAVMLGPIISIINTVLEGFLWLDNVLGGMLAPTIMALAGAYLFLRLQTRMAAQEEAVAAGERMVFMNGEAATRVRNMVAQAYENTLRATGIQLNNIEAQVRNTGTASMIWQMVQMKAMNFWYTVTDAARMRQIALAMRQTVIDKILAAGSMLKTLLLGGEAAATDTLTFAGVRQNIMSKASTAATWLAIAARGAYQVVTGILTFATYALTGAIWGQAIASKASAAASWIASTGLWAMASGAWAAAGPIIMLVGALLLLGVAMFVALHSPPLWIGLGLLAILFWALVPGLTALAPVLAAAGTGMIFFGFGAAIAGVGMLTAGVGALFFGGAMIMVAVALVIASVALWIAVGAILALALGVTLIGLFAWIAAPGLIFLAAAIVILSIVLVSFATISWLVLPPLFLLAIAVSMIGISMALMFNAMSNGVGDIGTMASGLREIAAAMSEMSLGSVFKFLLLTEGFENMIGVGDATPALKATADVIKSTIEVDTTKVEAVEDLVDSLSTLAIAAAISPGLVIAGALMGGLSEAFGGGPGAAGGETGQDIYLVMDPAGTKVIAKAVDVQLNKMHSVIARRS